MPCSSSIVIWRRCRRCRTSPEKNFAPWQSSTIFPTSNWTGSSNTQPRSACKPGEIYVRAGDTADKMMVVAGRRTCRAGLRGANENVFTTYAGAVTGVLPYSRMKVFPATVRAVAAFASSAIPGGRVRRPAQPPAGTGPPLGSDHGGPDPRIDAGRAAARSIGRAGQACRPVWPTS